MLKKSNKIVIIDILERFQKVYIYLNPFAPCDSNQNTDLPSNSNISKTVRVNTALTRWFLRVFDKLSNDIQVDRLFSCGSVVIDV